MNSGFRYRVNHKVFGHWITDNKHFQPFRKTLFQLNIKRFTYSFLTNQFNPHWVIVEDPCKQAMIEKYGIHQGTGQADEPLALR